MTRVAVAQPGAFNAEVKTAAAAHGFWYPPDPSSFEICSIGGNAATNAGGLCCVKYGVTTDYVLGMEVVLADGTAVRLGGPRLKDVAGLSLTKLFVGSEGTLGVITELTLRLLPAPPPASHPRRDLRRRSRRPPTPSSRSPRSCGRRMLELMDNGSINAVEDMVQDGPGPHGRGAAARPLGRARRGRGAPRSSRSSRPAAAHGAAEVFTTADPDEGEAFAAARRAAFPAMERLGTLLLEDVGVPVPELPALVHGIREIAAARDTAHRRSSRTPATATPTRSSPTRRATPAAEARARVAFGEVMDLALVARRDDHRRARRRPAQGAVAGRQLGPDVMALTRRIKDALDPDGILNPGVVL